MPDVTINFNLDRMAKTARKEIATFLNLVATDLILDTQKGLETGQSQTGRPFKQLAASTIAIKRERGQPLTPLIATGEMRDRVKIGKRATPGSTSATVVVGPSRSFIGGTHQAGDGVPKRLWFPVKITKRFRPQLNKDIAFFQRRVIKSVGGR